MKPIIVVGLGFGDEGKGTVVDALVRRYRAGLVVRYNGGPQASHTVCTDDGVVHSFSQFGSGTFVPRTYTLLGAAMLINPLSLMCEYEDLVEKNQPDALSRVFIDGRAIMVTPYHRAVNRLRELSRGDSRHGSCGAGVGECVADALACPTGAIRIGDLHQPDIFLSKLSLCAVRMRALVNEIKLEDTPKVMKQLSTFSYDARKLRERYAAFYAEFRERILTDYDAGQFISSQEAVVFEGAQGVLLDETFGFHPYTTWSTTTTLHAEFMLEEAEVTDKPLVVGVLRSFMTRHGAGPFPTEDQTMTRLLSDPNNPRNDWQGGLRCGVLDLPLLQYALRSNGGVDVLAVTHMDKVNDAWPVAHAYNRTVLRARHPTFERQQRMGAELATVTPMQHEYKRVDFLPAVSELLATPVGLISAGPLSRDKQFYDVMDMRRG